MCALPDGLWALCESVSVIGLSTLSVNNKDFIESVVQLPVQAVRVRSIWGFEAVVSPVFGFLWSR